MSAPPVSVRLTCDAAPLISALAEVSAKIAEGLFGLAQLPEDLVAVQCDGASAANAGEVCVRLYPSESLRGFVAALGARDVE